MLIGIISLFPEMFRAITEYGIIGRAVKNGLLIIHFWNPRYYSQNKHKTIDDRLYGGGRGMLMMAQPLIDAIHAAKSKLGGEEDDIKVIYLSPQGRKLNQQDLYNIMVNNKLILVCGRYKGIDERIIEMEIDEEWSIGDYVLSGGELPAMVIIDAVARLIPGVLNHYESLKDDSFITGLLDCHHYTRPKIFNNIQVPSVLLSGNHAKIKRWRKKHSLGRTWLRRPDLLDNLLLTEEETILLTEFKKEIKDC
ncbi:tRNA (guanosine(37)-N1)-methyltransferase TrmD [Arsenophonus endosymbiont of Lipoptena cervi]|uniref:tRNA (guanosine(37)-N1)-methyltransferase TrmD n=1 Tax=Arsenophonus endosymbiont of Lipoptena cervi TaxID=363258 RepID=UPI00376EC43C